MIIAIATLISMLLFGGPDEIFLISAIEKGIKKEIGDKDIQKDIKLIIKDYKKIVKSYSKLRKEQRKELDALFASQTTKRNDFESLSEVMLSTLEKYQNETINTRIEVLNMITENEWAGILELEKINLEKENETAAKGKNKDITEKPFSNFESSLNSLIADDLEKQRTLDQLQKVREQFKQLKSFVQDTRNEFYVIITNKNSSLEDLLSVAKRNNKLRKTSVNALIDMHQILAKNVSSEDWPKVAKEFNKLIKN